MDGTSKEAALLGKSMESSVLLAASSSPEAAKVVGIFYGFRVQLSTRNYPFSLIFDYGSKGAIEALHNETYAFPSIYPVYDKGNSNPSLTISVGEHKNPEELTYKQCKAFVNHIAAMPVFERSAKEAVKILNNLPDHLLSEESDVTASVMMRLGK